MTPVKVEGETPVDTFLETVTGDNEQYPGIGQSIKLEGGEDNQSGNDETPEREGDMEGEGIEGYEEEGRGAGDSSQSSSEWGNNYPQDEPVTIKEEMGEWDN